MKTTNKAQMQELPIKPLLVKPVVTNRYYFDCWKRYGKLRSRVILATSEEDAIAIFKSKYPDMNFDRPFI